MNKFGSKQSLLRCKCSNTYLLSLRTQLRTYQGLRPLSCTSLPLSPKYKKQTVPSLAPSPYNGSLTEVIP